MEIFKCCTNLAQVQFISLLTIVVQMFRKGDISLRFQSNQINFLPNLDSCTLTVVLLHSFKCIIHDCLIVWKKSRNACIRWFRSDWTHDNAESRERKEAYVFFTARRVFPSAFLPQLGHLPISDEDRLGSMKNDLESRFSGSLVAFLSSLFPLSIPIIFPFHQLSFPFDLQFHSHFRFSVRIINPLSTSNCPHICSSSFIFYCF